MAKTEAVKEKKEAPVKKEKAPAPAAKKPAAKHVDKENYRAIIRIAGKDMSGELNFRRALLRVRGFSHTLAVAASQIVIREMGFPENQKIGELTDAQIDKVDNILMNIQNYKVPAFLLNRRKDRVTGENKHVIMNDLLFENQQDVEAEKRSNTWRGYRHNYGQKVRGQKTRNTGRTGMAVGVLRKSIAGAAPAAAAAAKPAAGAAAPAAKPAEKKPAAAEKK